MKRLTKIRFPEWNLLPNGLYKLAEKFTYYSPRYNEIILLKQNMLSDGATFAPDLLSRGWGVHDVLRRTKLFNSGKECTNFQASMILFDIMWEEGYKVRAPIWFVGTLIWGYVPEKLKKPFRKTLSENS